MVTQWVLLTAACEILKAGLDQEKSINPSFDSSCPCLLSFLAPDTKPFATRLHKQKNLSPARKHRSHAYRYYTTHRLNTFLRSYSRHISVSRRHHICRGGENHRRCARRLHLNRILSNHRPRRPAFTFKRHLQCSCRILRPALRREEETRCKNHNRSQRLRCPRLAII